MGTFRTIAVVGGCVAPSFAFNVWPKAAGVLSGSAALDGETAAILIFQTAAVVVMALCLPEFARAKTWSKKLAALSLAVVLGIINYMAAIEVASHSRDLKAAVARGSMSDSAGVQRELADLTDSRNRLPQHTPATAGMVTAAQSAVTAAEKSRTDECAKRGPFCRDREADERTARAALADIEGRRALTERAEQIETGIRTARAKLSANGAAPKHEDGAAWRIGQFLVSLGFNLGADPAGKVAEWWPMGQALAVELIALLGPLVLLRDRDEPRPARIWSFPKLRRRQASKVTAPLPSVDDAVYVEPIAAVAGVGKTVVSRTAATPAKSRKPKLAKAAAVTPARQWYDQRIIERAGHDQPCGDAFKDYESFAQGRGEQPMTLTAFGIAMRDDLKVEKITTPSKRNFYRGIALKGRLALVAGS